MKLKDKFLERLATHLEKANKIRLRNRMKNLIREGVVQLGENSYGTPEFIIDKNSASKISIGKYCSMADEVKIFNGSNHNTKWVSTFPFRKHFNLNDGINDGHPFSKGDVKIGNDVWIGYGVFILSGVTIGDGAVITAGSVVSANVEPFAMVGGVPAKIIRKRFDEISIEKLLKIKWWNWNEEKIREAVPLLSSENIDEFLKKYS